MDGTIFEGRDVIYNQIKTSECIDPEKKTIEKRSEVIGRILTKFRMNRGYTQQEISNAIGIAQQTYAGYERGRHEPSIEILIRIADIYGASLDLITGRYVSTSIEAIKENVLQEQINISQNEDDDINEIVELHDHREFIKSLKKPYNRAKKKSK